jgi:hypothetical protein
VSDGLIIQQLSVELWNCPLPVFIPDNSPISITHPETHKCLLAYGKLAFHGLNVFFSLFSEAMEE